MFYDEIIQRMIREEKNPINKMYLNEINMHSRKFSEVLNKKMDFNEHIKEIATAMTDFSATLTQPKYEYSKVNNSGFKSTSKLFEPYYIYDLLTKIIESTGVLENSSMKWGIKTFSTDQKFHFRKLYNKDKDYVFTFRKSEPVLSLVQPVDYQIRALHRRQFSKYIISVPIILFDVRKVLTVDDAIKFNHLATQAFEMNKVSKAIIIAENLDRGFYYNLDNSYIDKIFVLRKCYLGGKSNRPISEEVIEALIETVEDIILPDENEFNVVFTDGIIE